MIKTKTLRIIKPIDYTWEEVGDVVRQLQRQLVPLYNSASIAMYQKLLDPESRLKISSPTKQIQQWTTDLVYHPVMNTIHCSYLALGVTSKIRSSYAGSKAKDIKTGVSRPPLMTGATFPLIWNYQNGFIFEKKDDAIMVNVPFPMFEKKEKVDKYRPWEKYDFIDSPRKKLIPFLLKTRSHDNYEDETIIADILEKKYLITALELITKKKKWMFRAVVDIEETEIVLDKQREATIMFAFDRPITVSMPGKILRIKKNIVEEVTRKQLSRMKQQSEQSGYERTGHGKRHKFSNIEKISLHYRERKKKIIENWVVLVNKFLIANKIGTVRIIPADIDEKKKSLLTRLHWNAAEVQDKLEIKLKQTGVTILTK